MHVAIAICPLSKKEPPFPELSGVKTEDLRLTHMAILEGGMTSGKTSVYLSLVGTDGKRYNAQLSAAMFQNMASALSGAEARFRDAVKGN